MNSVTSTSLKALILATASMVIPTLTWAVPLYSENFSAPLVLTYEASQWEREERDVDGTITVVESFEQALKIQVQVDARFSVFFGSAAGETAYRMAPLPLGTTERASVSLANGPINQFRPDFLVQGSFDYILVTENVFQGRRLLDFTHGLILVGDTTAGFSTAERRVRGLEIIEPLVNGERVLIDVFSRDRPNTSNALAVFNDQSGSSITSYYATDLTLTMQLGVIPLPASAWGLLTGFGLLVGVRRGRG